MSELTPEELVEEVAAEVDEAPVIPAPVDPTLTISGEAADAKATGDAIAAVIGKLLLNGKSAVNNAIILYATDILMSSADGAITISAAVEAANDRDATTIMYDAGNLVTIKAKIDEMVETIDSELSNEDIDTIFESVFGGEE